MYKIETLKPCLDEKEMETILFKDNAQEGNEIGTIPICRK